ncbi:MAG: hypothetical protein Q4G71_11890 [Pseudomonadota bacterium]|nr:hypothetical protein [Pseudomonadota bacterium]
MPAKPARCAARTGSGAPRSPADAARRAPRLAWMIDMDTALHPHTGSQATSGGDGRAPILLVSGPRPEVIKMAPVYHALRR